MSGTLHSNLPRSATASRRCLFKPQRKTSNSGDTFHQASTARLTVAAPAQAAEALTNKETWVDGQVTCWVTMSMYCVVRAELSVRSY